MAVRAKEIATYMMGKELHGVDRDVIKPCCYIAI